MCPPIHDDICMASDALAKLFRSIKGCTICSQQTNDIHLEFNSTADGGCALHSTVAASTFDFGYNRILSSTQGVLLLIILRTDSQWSS